MTPSKPVRVVTDGISKPVRVVTHGGDPVRVVTEGIADPVRIVTHGISDPVRIVSAPTPPIPPQPDTWYCGSWAAFPAVPQIPIANCEAAYQPRCAASYADSKINLAHPGTHDASEGVAPAWNKTTGWHLDGSTTWLNTGIIPAWDWTIIACYENWQMQNSRYLFGVVQAVDRGFGLVSLGGGGSMLSYNGRFAMNAPFLGTGVYGFADRVAYRNGLAELLPIPAPGAALTVSMIIGAGNNGAENSPVSFAHADLLALAIYNIPLTQPQILAAGSAMAALPCTSAAVLLESNSYLLLENGDKILLE